MSEEHHRLAAVRELLNDVQQITGSSLIYFYSPLDHLFREFEDVAKELRSRECPACGASHDQLGEYFLFFQECRHQGG